eukprot:TRINITY_DN10291_c0_g1_i6.p1 TRINITY_DN10291_c0_g1~~TRINITY_DN10291_c0_g1_i6.p1  ORF type:complete len:346 (+),score=49.73 TRINITY_DN10291_c0_g1_i6:63-1040(+)
MCIRDRYQQLAKEAADEEKALKLRQKVSWFFILFVLPVSCGIGIINASTREESTTFIGILLEGIMAFMIFLGLLEFKKRSYKQNKLTIPLAVILTWLIFILPFMVGIPCTAMVIEDFTQDHIYFLKASVYAAAIMLVIVVTLVAGLINWILSRIEFERQIKSVVFFLQQELHKLRIKGDPLALRAIYEWLVFNNYEEGKLKEELITNFSPAVMTNLLPNDLKKYPHYAKEIVMAEIYVLRKKAEEKKQKDLEKSQLKSNEKGQSLLLRMFTCCFGFRSKKVNNEFAFEPEESNGELVEVQEAIEVKNKENYDDCLLYTSPSPRDS